jgi:predicted nucleic acid-binding protein
VKLFFDACIVIYQVECADPFYSRVAGTVAALGKDHPGLGYAVSRLSLLECLVRPLRDSDTAAIGRYQQFFTADDLVIVELTPRVIDLATRLRAAHGIRTPDAIQAACALSLRGRTIFMTGDASFRKIKGLEVLLV